MPNGKGLSLFLIDGEPSGRIACELFNWTGKAFKIPRTRLKDSSDRSEMHKAGVYLLLGRDESDPNRHVVYVGEAEAVYSRLIQHLEKDFWNDVVAFISKDENLNKAHIKFLEFEVFNKISRAGRARLENRNTPNQPSISELEQAVMGEFFNNLQLVVSTLGYRVFEPLTQVDAVRPGGQSPAFAEDEYFTNGPRGADARAVMTDEGLVVLEGSRVATDTVPSAAPWIIDLRERLFDSGILNEINGQPVFTRDYLASSPSAAAAAILGRSSNGLAEWKDGHGRTLKENQERP